MALEGRRPLTFQEEVMRRWKEGGSSGRGDSWGRAVRRTESSPSSTATLTGSISQTETASRECSALNWISSSPKRKRPPHCLRPSERTCMGTIKTNWFVGSSFNLQTLALMHPL